MCWKGYIALYCKSITLYHRYKPFRPIKCGLAAVRMIFNIALLQCYASKEKYEGHTPFHIEESHQQYAFDGVFDCNFIIGCSL